MTKTTLALAVTAALAASASVQADTVLYGSARVSADYINNDSDKTWDLVNNDSLMGVRGEEDLGGGLSAIYRYQFIVDTTEGSSGFATSSEPRFVGLSGGFGTVSLGTHETPYNHTGGIVNIFNSIESYSYTGFLGGSFDAFTLSALDANTAGAPVVFSDSRDGLFSLSNSIYYSTPDIKGFSAEALLATNGAFNEALGYSDGIDVWNIGAKYNYGPFSAGLSYVALEGDRVYANLGNGRNASTDLGLDQWIVGLGYSAGPFTLGLIYERGSFNEWGLLKGHQMHTASGTQVTHVASFPHADDAQNWYLAGSYTFGNNVVKAAYGQLDTGINSAVWTDKIDNYLLGYQYNFSKRTALWVEYIGRGVDDEGTVFYQGDRDVVSIGTRVDF